jgi:hypothetical protein
VLRSAWCTCVVVGRSTSSSWNPRMYECSYLALARRCVLQLRLLVVVVTRYRWRIYRLMQFVRCMPWSWCLVVSYCFMQ